MYTNTAIITKMQADKFLGISLDHALSGVHEEMLEQGKNIQTGATRLAFYASCFTTNYQDVCANQKAEDIRFSLNIIGLVGKRKVIARMIEIYVNLLLQDVSEGRLKRIMRALFQKGATFASGSLSKQALGAAITGAVVYSFGLSISVDRVLLKFSTIAVTLTSWYAYVQKAADAANKIKQQDYIYYHMLYAEKLEMLYFLIDPIISRNPPLKRLLSSNDEIVNAIMRIIK